MGGQYFVKKYPLNCIKQAATLKCIELLLFPLCPPPGHAINFFSNSPIAILPKLELNILIKVSTHTKSRIANFSVG